MAVTFPDPVAAEVERRVRDELARLKTELYNALLDDALAARARGDTHHWGALRKAASRVHEYRAAGLGSC